MRRNGHGSFARLRRSLLPCCPSVNPGGGARHVHVARLHGKASTERSDAREAGGGRDYDAIGLQPPIAFGSALSRLSLLAQAMRHDSAQPQQQQQRGGAGAAAVPAAAERSRSQSFGETPRQQTLSVGLATAAHCACAL